MRGSIYDTIDFTGNVSLVPQSFTGSSAVNGNTVPTTGFTDAALRAFASPATGTPTAAALAVTLQESANGYSGWANALDNTSTVIGFTLTAVIGVTGNVTSGSYTIVSMSSVAGLYVGQAVSGTGIPAGAVITAVGATTITVSAAATATNTGVALTFPTEGAARIEGLALNRKKYLRAVITSSFTGGTTPAIIGFAEIVQGGPPQQLPVSSAVSNT
jgi:hypothetical protein